MSARRSAAGSPLAGVRGLLLDLDGVIALAGAALPGAAEALADLDRRGIPFRIVTNTSMVSRASLARWGERMGTPVAAERFQSALSVSAAETARRHPGEPLFVLASEDARREFAGQRLLTAAEAAAPGARVAAVVIGDSPEEATWENLNLAFRLVRGGAELIGMHKNRWWITPDGPTLDSGAYVAGLEFASGVKARIVGKPSPDFFRVAAADLAREIRERDADAGRPPRRVLRHDLAMVGDDIRTDVLAAQRVGLRGVFVLSGKHGREDLAAATGAGRAPDLVADSLLDVVAGLDR